MRRVFLLSAVGAIVAVGGSVALAGPLVSSAAAATSVCDAVAGNIVQNCGFETGDLTHWDSTPGDPQFPPTVVGSGHSGNWHLLDDAGASPDDVSQMLTGAVPGASYALTFYARNGAVAGAGNGQSFVVSMDNVVTTGTTVGTKTLFSDEGDGSNITETYGAFTVDFTVPAPADFAGTPVLHFTITHGDPYYLDDVSVVRTSAAPHLTVTAPSTATTGTAVNVTVNAVNSDASAYDSNETLTLASTDPAATAPISVALVHGTATFPLTLDTTGDQTVTVSGTSQNLTVTSNPITVGAPSTPSVTNPTIAAALTSADPKTHYGWYRDPVVISYTCHAGSSAENAAGCPAPVILTASRKANAVTRTVTDTDGGTASVTSTVNLDRTAPHVTVTGATNGKTYPHQRKLHAHCTDALSGVASCTLTSHHKGHTVNYKVVGTDKAGNKTTVQGDYSFKR